MMRIHLASILVDDQTKALAFYTNVLGFLPKADVDMADPRWLTVVSPEPPEATELVLEPDTHPAAGPYKRALVADGIPFTAFAVDDCAAEAAPGARRRLHPDAPWQWARSRPRSSRTRAAT